MTEVNGLHLAYKGFVGGLAGGYVWTAIAMSLAAIVHEIGRASCRERVYLCV